MSIHLASPPVFAAAASEFLRLKQRVSQVPNQDESSQSTYYFPTHTPSRQSRSQRRTYLTIRRSCSVSSACLSPYNQPSHTDRSEQIEVFHKQNRSFSKDRASLLDAARKPNSCSRCRQHKPLEQWTTHAIRMNQHLCSSQPSQICLISDSVDTLALMI